MVAQINQVLFVVFTRQPGRLTVARADALLQEHYPDLADMVEDSETAGGVHFYFLSDGSSITVDRRRGMIWTDEHSASIIGDFDRRPLLG